MFSIPKWMAYLQRNTNIETLFWFDTLSIIIFYSCRLSRKNVRLRYYWCYKLTIILFHMALGHLVWRQLASRSARLDLWQEGQQLDRCMVVPFVFVSQYCHYHNAYCRCRNRSCHSKNVADHSLRSCMVTPPLNIHIHQTQAWRLPLQRDEGKMDCRGSLRILHKSIRLCLWHAGIILLDQQCQCFIRQPLVVTTLLYIE